MSKSITVTLGGVDYVVPKLNIGQLEEITAAFADSSGRPIAYVVFGVAMRRSEPKVTDVAEIEADFPEVSEAVARILMFAGLKKAETDGPNPPVPAEATG